MALIELLSNSPALLLTACAILGLLVGSFLNVVILRLPPRLEWQWKRDAREILEEHGGGLRAGLHLQCWLPGGASTDFLLPEHLDTPMDYDSIAKVGSRMGTGQMIVLDDQVELLGALKNLMHFFAQESCGWCTPCRDGLPWAEQVVGDLQLGRGRAEDIATLQQLTRWLGPGRTFCAYAPGAMEPLQSALKFFRPVFEQAAGQRKEAS